MALIGNKIKKTAEDWILDIIVYGFVIMFSLAILFPFWSQLVESLSSQTNVIGIKLWPKGFYLDAYINVFKQKTVGLAYLNTIMRTFFGTILTVIVTFSAAYPLSRRKMPFNKVLTAFVVITMFFVGGIIPEYMVIRNLHLLDNRLVYILPYAVNGFYILVMRNFLYSIPNDLEETAFIDGANEIVIAFKIFLPLSTPIIATVALWSAVAHWNDWFRPMIYIRIPEMQVMMVILRKILLESQISAMFDNPSSNMVQTEDSVRAATMFVAVVPILMAYPFAQKYFVQGLMMGAVKG